MFRRCQHLRRRCIHGDEGWARMKVYTLRWWKPPVIHRQACLDCGRALDLPPICASLPGRHLLAAHVPSPLLDGGAGEGTT